MITNIRSRWPLPVFTSGLIMVLSACAPNSVERAALPGLDGSLSAAEQESGRYGTLLRLASSTRAAGDPAAAVNMYQQAIAVEQGRPEAYTLLGDTLIELEAFDEAASVFRKSLERDAESLAARLGYGRVLVALQRPEAALPHYETALRQAPRNLQAHNGLGVAYDLAGEHDMAQKVYRDGLAIAPDSMLLRNNLGLSLALSGDHDEAVSLLRIVADEPGAGARNRQNLALALGLAGDLAAAERVSRLDLDEDAVRSNVAYFATLAAIDDQRKRAAALGTPPPSQRANGANEETVRHLTALALGGDGLELSLIPTGRWFLNLGEYSSSRQVDIAWRELRAEHHDLLGDFDRLAGRDDGSQPLLVGPLNTAEAAEEICADLEAYGRACKALAL